MNKKIYAIWVLGILLFVPIINEAVFYCDGDALIENITVNGRNISISNVQCDYGCSEESWINLMNPGCRESPLEILLVGIAIIVGFILLMRFLLWG